jgi:hypothetical protein
MDDGPPCNRLLVSQNSGVEASGRAEVDRPSEHGCTERPTAVSPILHSLLPAPLPPPTLLLPFSKKLVLSFSFAGSPH